MIRRCDDEQLQIPRPETVCNPKLIRCLHHVHRVLNVVIVEIDRECLSKLSESILDEGMLCHSIIAPPSPGSTWHFQLIKNLTIGR